VGIGEPGAPIRKDDDAVRAGSPDEEKDAASGVIWPSRHRRGCLTRHASYFRFRRRRSSHNTTMTTPMTGPTRLATAH